MKKTASPQNSRRSFINKLTKASVAAALAPDILSAAGTVNKIQLLRQPIYSPNDNIQIASPLLVFAIIRKPTSQLLYAAVLSPDKRHNQIT